MVSHKAVAALLVVHVATMLAAQTEAFVPFFTYSELQRMQERERSKGQKKSLSMQQRSEDPREIIEDEENEVFKLTAPVETGRRLDARPLEKWQAILEALLSEALPPAQPEGEERDREGSSERAVLETETARFNDLPRATENVPLASHLPAPTLPAPPPPPQPDLGDGFISRPADTAELQSCASPSSLATGQLL